MNKNLLEFERLCGKKFLLYVFFKKLLFLIRLDSMNIAFRGVLTNISFHKASNEEIGQVNAPLFQKNA